MELFNASPGVFINLSSVSSVRVSANTVNERVWDEWKGTNVSRFKEFVKSVELTLSNSEKIQLRDEFLANFLKAYPAVDAAGDVAIAEAVEKRAQR